MSIELRSLKNLGSAYFRVDWIGDVVARSLKAAGTPSVNVVFSPRQALNDTGPDRDLPQIELIIPAAYLRLLRVGDIWHHGQRIKEGDGEQLCFANIDISRESVDVKPVGLPIAVDDELRYPLPFDQYCSHRLHTGSYAARVQIDEKTSLLVPCMELIRFYFGASGTLLARLFSGAITGKDLYESARLNAARVAHIKLSKGIPGVAAATVARIALDHHAARAANWVIKSGVSAAANGTPYYPATIFPFEGKTTLTAVGEWVIAQGHDIFVVDRLTSCSYPFPFQSMFYELHPSQRRDASNGLASSDGIHARNNARGGASRKHNSSELDEGAVNATLTVAPVLIDESADAFPDLREKPVRRIANPEHSSGAAGGLNRASLAIGPRETSGLYRGVDVSTERVPVTVNPMSGPRAVLEAVEILRKTSEDDIQLNELPGFRSASVSPFSRIEYVRQSDQDKFPGIVGTRIRFITSERSREFLVLVYESPVDAQSRPAVMISAGRGLQPFGRSHRWMLGTLWVTARYLAGISQELHEDIMAVSHFIPGDQANDPLRFAGIFQKAMEAG